MRLYVYEYLTGGGLFHAPGIAPTGSLLAEGAAMAQALISDFVESGVVEVVTTRDARLANLASAPATVITVASAVEELSVFKRLAAAADWTLLIAPETGGALLNRCRLVESVGGRLLSPPPAFVAIAASKQATAEWLDRCGIPVPRGVLLGPGDNNLPAGLALPAVAKPLDGCGSLGVRLVRVAAEIRAGDGDAAIRVEEFIPGTAASVAVLCGPKGNHALPACEQRLSADGRFMYQGGRLPLAPQLDARARRLALAAAGALPEPRGYVGVDLVLGEMPDGSGDRVIEINPRPTTSYVGLRALARTNLAAAMLAVVSGQRPDLCFRDEPVEFTVDGTIL